MMSGRLKSALKRVPATKPNCTESVSQLAAPSLRCHSLLSAGTTAEPLNQSDMPSSSAVASSASVRQRDGEASFDEAGLCKGEIVAQGAVSGRAPGDRLPLRTKLLQKPAPAVPGRAARLGWGGERGQSR